MPSFHRASGGVVGLVAVYRRQTTKLHRNYLWVPCGWALLSSQNPAPPFLRVSRRVTRGPHQNKTSHRREPVGSREPRKATGAPTQANNLRQPSNEGRFHCYKKFLTERNNRRDQSHLDIELYPQNTAFHSLVFHFVLSVTVFNVTAEYKLAVARILLLYSYCSKI